MQVADKLEVKCEHNRRVKDGLKDFILRNRVSGGSIHQNRDQGRGRVQIKKQMFCLEVLTSIVLVQFRLLRATKAEEQIISNFSEKWFEMGLMV